MAAKSDWTTIGVGEKGTPFGHVPGHTYHDVRVKIGRRGQKVRIQVTEVWGSAQGYDEEHGRNRIVAIDTDLDAAVRTANSRAKEAGMRADYMIQALSTAHADAVDTLEGEAEGAQQGAENSGKSA